MWSTQSEAPKWFYTSARQNLTSFLAVFPRNVTKEDEGYYHCEASNQKESIKSQPAFLLPAGTVCHLEKTNLFNVTFLSKLKQLFFSTPCFFHQMFSTGWCLRVFRVPYIQHIHLSWSIYHHSFVYMVSMVIYRSHDRSSTTLI